MRKLKRETICRRLFSFICVLFLSFSILVPTAEADETGTAPEAGSGGGSNVPFSLVESKPADGEADIDTDTTIWLLFNKNVVNMTVAENNKANITLKDSAGNSVNAEVTMKDDQIEPEFRREMIVVPGDSLEEGTKYILTIGRGIMAKNGQSLGKDYTVVFTTEGKTENKMNGGQTAIKGPEVAADASLTASAAGTADSAAAATASAVTATETSTSADTVSDSSRIEKGETPSNPAGLIGAAAGIIILAVLVIVMIRKRIRR